MADVFISYSRDDQATARRFAEGLHSEGFSVWWDQALSAGEAFDRVTEKALEDARAVVVLWSRRSVDSNWVRAEATQAHANHRLVPVMIEPCKRPMMFELTHTADLSGWNGKTDTPAWQSFARDLRKSVGKDASPSLPALAAQVERSRRPGPAIIGLAAAFLVGAGLLWVLWHKDGPPAPTATPTISTSTPAQTGVTLAVLPFANLSSDPAQEHFADGLTEEILNHLAQIPALRLTGRTSSFSLKGKNEDLREIGRKLGVANLLEGSVRKDGDKLRITAQLIRADDGTHQWSKTYDRSLSSVFAVQDEIAKDVAQALSVKLDVATLNRAQGGTTNVDAYDLYLQWRTLVLSERHGTEVARQKVPLLREAVALDPKFALAWDGLALELTGMSRMVQGAESEQLLAEATHARARVAALAPESWMVQRERAYSLWAEGKWSEAISVAQAIMKTGPLTYEHTYPYINLIFAVGRIEETVTLVSQLQALEPLAMFMSRDQQWNLTAANRIEEAEVEYRRSAAIDGSHLEPDGIAFLRMLAREDANPQALRALHRSIQQADPVTPPYFRVLGDKLSDHPAMREFLTKDFDTRRDPSIRLIADSLGDAELSLAAMRAMWKGRSPTYEKYWELWLAPFSGMRSLPGFKELMREVGLVDYWRQTGDWGDICKPVGETDFACH